MTVEMVDVGRLKLNKGQIPGVPENPRQIKDERFRKLVQSVRDDPEMMELREIIAYDNDGELVVIAGNMRLLVCKELGYKEVPCKILPRGTAAEKLRAYAVKDNNQWGEWDFDVLANQWDMGELMEWGFTKEDLGWLDNIGDIDETWVDDFDIEKAITKIEIPITKSGDIWIINNRHRILCGDATKKEFVIKLMDGKKGTLGFTSPPYWVGKEYETQKSVEEINSFIRMICESYNFCIKKDESRIVINTSTGFTTSFDKRKKRHVLLLIDKWANNFFELNWNLRHIRHWLKEGQLVSISPKTDLIDQHCEFLGTFENDEGEELKFDDTFSDEDINLIEVFYNIEGKNRGGEKTRKKWALRSYWNDIRGTANQSGHCASFPLELPFRHLLLYTKKNELVVDLMIGSGTTLIACEKANRICYGMEIDPKYIDIILLRYINFVKSNEGVFLLEDGEQKSYQEVVRERGK